MHTSEINVQAARQNISNHFVFTAAPAAPVAAGAGITIAAGSMLFFVEGVFTGAGVTGAALFPTGDYTVPISTTRHYAILYKRAGNTLRIVPLDFAKKGSPPTTVAFDYVHRDEVLVACVRLTTDGVTPFIPGTTLLSTLANCYVVHCNGIPQDLALIATYGTDIS